jgi:hypothetical protein
LVRVCIIRQTPDMPRILAEKPEVSEL